MLIRDMVPNNFVPNPQLPKWKAGLMTSSDIFFSTFFRFSNVYLFYLFNLYFFLLLFVLSLLFLSQVFWSAPLLPRDLSAFYSKKGQMHLLTGFSQIGRPGVT